MTSSRQHNGALHEVEVHFIALTVGVLSSAV
jgi:hypothetical protein